MTRYALEFRDLDSQHVGWQLWAHHDSQYAADSMLKSAQVADTRDGVARAWRVRETKRGEFVRMYSTDVSENPEAYKDRVRHDPEASAMAITEGLSEAECGDMLTELRRERRLVHKAAAS
jgi:hypothetical protein